MWKYPEANMKIYKMSGNHLPRIKYVKVSENIQRFFDPKIFPYLSGNVPKITPAKPSWL